MFTTPFATYLFRVRSLVVSLFANFVLKGAVLDRLVKVMDAGEVNLRNTNPEERIIEEPLGSVTLHLFLENHRAQVIVGHA